MVKIAQPQSSIEVWDAGLYPAKVTACQETVSTYPGSEGKPRLQWTIRIRNEETDETNDIFYWTNTTLSDHPQATFRPLVRAVLPDADLDSPDATVDTDDMVGKRCRVVLGINAERGRNKIEKVLPAEARKVAKAAARPAEELEEAAVPF